VQFAGIIFRRDAALAVGAFDDRYAHAADWDLWWKLAKRFPAAYTNLCLGGYRRFRSRRSPRSSPRPARGSSLPCSG
jgi:hypothetical protein